MGANWKAGLIFWRPHTDAEGVNYPLAHLHPDRMSLELEAQKGNPARTVQLEIAFSLHTFTRTKQATDGAGDLYRDNREVRVFCRERYQLSLDLDLRRIVRELQTRPCQFATSKSSGKNNYVTLDDSRGVQYGVFFDLKRRRELGPDEVLLMVQSAYALEPSKPDPGKGKISFRALLGHAIRGTTPKPPR